MAKQVTLESLAKMMKTGFDEATKQADNHAGIIKLTRQEMAKDEDVKEIKATVNSLYKMLDARERKKNERGGLV